MKGRKAKGYLVILLLAAANMILWGDSPAPSLRFEPCFNKPGIRFLSWDTEGGEKVQKNLLRKGSAVTIRYRIRDLWRDGSVFRKRVIVQEGNRPSARYTIGDVPSPFTWEIRSQGSDLIMNFSASREPVESIEIFFPFDPKTTPTTVLPSLWREDGLFELPAVINAPDFGPIVLSEKNGRPVSGRLLGSREKKTVDMILALPRISKVESTVLEFKPLLLPAPAELENQTLWRFARRGWLNALQACARWGDQAKASSARAGILGNNVISDPASVSIWFYADQALFLPEIYPRINLMDLVRSTVDYWLDNRMRRDEKGRETGEITGYWEYGNFLDANAGPLIAAWDYVEATADLDWLKRRIERLELVADFLARRDIDGDGMIEAVQSGNRGALVQPNRSCAWWDALNCGHKDGYTNALIYRAFRCFADLEDKLGRGEMEKRYGRLADRLKAAYAKTLYNPKTGWLSWWKSRDGELHDYASPTINGLAIEYGLVEPGLAQRILDRLWKKIEEAGFDRFDLGVPPQLVPVNRSDYLLPDAFGIPLREDGADTFGQYMNGGITAGHVLHFLAAHYVLGHKTAEADRVLRAMLERQMRGEFQNGVQDASGLGIDWTTWDGRPSGYEGYLADSFRFLQAVLLREEPFRQKYYRPLEIRPPSKRLQ